MLVFNASQSGQIDVLKKLISGTPALVHSKHPKTSATPLHIAAASGQIDALLLLLAHGASHEAQDKDGSLPIHLAASEGHVACLSELIKGPRKLTVKKMRTLDGATPLHLAVQGGWTEAMSLLLDCGSRADTRDKSGRTALDLAVGLGDEQALSLLQGAKTGSGILPPQGAVTQSNEGSTSAASKATVAARPESAVARSTPSSRPQTSSAIPPSSSKAPSSTPVATAPPPIYQNEETVRLLNMLPMLMTEINLLKEKQQEFETQESERKKEIEMSNAAHMEKESSLMRRIDDLEARLLYSEERNKDGRSRVERLEELVTSSLKGGGTQQVPPPVPSAQEMTAIAKVESEIVHKDLQKLAESVSGVELMIRSLNRDIDTLHSKVATASLQSREDVEAKIQPLSTQIRVTSESLLRTSDKILELEARQKKLEETPPPPIPLLPSLPLIDISSPPALQSPAVPSSKRGPSGLSSEPPGTPSQSTSANFQGISRVEFESTMKRVEERVREAAEKEMAAKQMSRMAMHEEEQWGHSWRVQREDKEKELAMKLEGVEADIESLMLQVGGLEHRMEDLALVEYPPGLSG